jgi:hypothetical protein
MLPHLTPLMVARVITETTVSKRNSSFKASQGLKPNFGVRREHLQNERYIVVVHSIIGFLSALRLRRFQRLSAYSCIMRA